ncbi:MAG: polysaccharide biosynthesis/export family protein [Myxococcota bacterium]
MIGVAIGWAFTSLAAHPDYKVGVGDVIEIQVHGAALGNDGRFVVAGTGEVSLPCVDRVAVSAQSVSEIEQTLRKALMPDCYVDPIVTVKIEEFRSQRVDVLGAVGKPGVYFLEGPTTVRNILTRAGGIQTARSTGQVVVTRKGIEVVHVPIGELDGRLGDYELTRDDVVSVDEGRIVYVGGEVEKPGAIAYAEGVTVSEAVMKAGGHSEAARLAGVYVLRDGDKIPVNLRRILKGKDNDPQLRPGDQVVVPESPL